MLFLLSVDERDRFMSRQSAIRGYGLVSAQGNCANETFDAVLSGATLTSHRGSLSLSCTSNRVTHLALMAAREACDRAGWSAEALPNRRTALVIGSSKGPIENWLAMMENRAAYQPLVGVGALASDIGSHFGMTGPRFTFAAACASGLHAMIRAHLLIQNHEADRVLVIGAESSLHPIFIATFARMGVLSKQGACRPFNQNRDGFLMSEAAAAVCLEAQESGSHSLIIDAVAMASDAYHITGIDPTGESLRYVLRQLKSDKPVDLVHAHGTATDSNDPVELNAIDQIFACDSPSVFSHKAALGHTQGAAGMIGVVLNAMMHERQIVLPNVNTPLPFDTRSASVSSTPIPRKLSRSIVLAAGFGGATAGIGLRQT